jgi:ATP-binding cassette subfamily B protein
MVAELVETAEGAAEIRAFGATKRRRQRFSSLNQRAASANLDGMRMRTRFFSAVIVSQATVTALILLIAGLLAVDNRLSVGVVAAGVIAATRVFDPVTELVEYTDEIQSMRAALDRVAALVEASDDLTDRHVDGAGGDARTDAAIQLRGVSFAYEPGRPVLHEIDLEVAAGETIAVVGATGAGKSTLARLVTGLAAPSAGHVLVNGRDIAGLPSEERRRIVVTAFQEGFCVDGTIADNVTLGAPNATHDDVLVALDSVGATWWRDLPRGAATEVGTGGVALSNGQRQLLALARIALLDPHVVVLDEATSLLDAGTEAQVAAALERTFAGRTVVIVAHGRATAARLDRVIRLEHGRLVADGPPSSVLGASPTADTADALGACTRAPSWQRGVGTVARRHGTRASRRIR